MGSSSLSLKHVLHYEDKPLVASDGIDMHAYTFQLQIYREGDVEGEGSFQDVCVGRSPSHQVSGLRPAQSYRLRCRAQVCIASAPMYHQSFGMYLQTSIYPLTRPLLTAPVMKQPNKHNPNPNQSLYLHHAPGVMPFGRLQADGLRRACLPFRSAQARQI